MSIVSKRWVTKRWGSARPLLIAGLAAFGFAGHAALPEQAVAQTPPELKLKKPNALLLIDTSGSMRDRLSGANANCTQADGKSRYAILSEALTGTINDLKCTSSVAVQSNDCKPFINGDSNIQNRLSLDPYAWPVLTSGPAERRDAVVFCDDTDGNSPTTKCTPGNWTPGKVCKLHPNEWNQLSDGLLDTYAKQIRFGLMTFDGLSTLPVGVPLFSQGHSNSGYWLRPYNRVLGDVSWGQPDNCQSATNGSRCQLRWDFTTFLSTITDSNRQYSYWYRDGANNWLNGGRFGYSGSIRNFYAASVSLIPWSITYGEETTTEAHIDIGARNPNAPPNLGRMIGFGPSDWDVSNPTITLCNSEDDCTARHNEMVQKAILGASANLNHTTPLGGMMRDAYEFITRDMTTQGVHIPHAYNRDPDSFSALKGVIGPQTDPYVTGSDACRETAVVLVTDGNPYNDLTQKPSFYANLLEAEDVRTFVLGIATDTAMWSATGALGSAVPQDCKALDPATAFNVGQMCEPNGLRWRFADLARSNPGSGADADAIEACCTLVETAHLGGSGRPYFPSNQTEFKQDFNKVLNEIAGGTLSRTIPVFASAPATFTGVPNPAPNAPGAYFELRSSVQVTVDDTIWRGHLERVRYACDTVSGDLVPTIQTVDPNRGDRFSDNINDPSPTRARRFFTVIPNDDGVGDGDDDDDDDIGHTPYFIGSLRPQGTNPNAHDRLYNGGSRGDFRRLGGADSNGTDNLYIIEDFDDQIDSLPNPAANVQQALGISGGASSDCNSLTGTSSLSNCARRVLEWYGGKENPAGSTPSRMEGSAHCPTGSCSAMGGIYRSSPVIVPPPQPSDSDDQNFGRVRSNGGPSFFSQYASRPTMVYAQTVDGMLHAFTLTMNDFDGVAPDFDPPEVPVVDALDNNELWSFIPPAVMPNIWPNFNTHARVTDGQLAWANVVYERPYGENAGVSSTETTDWDYRTVLVVASGPSTIGGFYYALDVTDPTRPRFLWQLSYAHNSTQGAPRDRLFGKSAPGAAITHIKYRESGGQEKLLAVAILPGGDSYQVPSTTVVPRRLEAMGGSYWDPGDSRRHPRRSIRDWGTYGDPARSLTIVELSTGRILGRFVGSTADNPRHPSNFNDLTQTILSNHVTIDDQAFDSPITGIPAVYPNGPGKVSDRVYVGDADGTLWRIDLSSPDPDDWTARIAFDAYNRGVSNGVNESTMRDAWVLAGPGAGGKLDLTPLSATQAATRGQPIQTAPLLSLDDAGNLVVTFSTGDQEDFNTVSAGMVNMLISYSERFIGPGPQRYHAEIDDDQGLEVAFKDGGRVTGPINLFDGQLFYAYFIPDTANLCGQGTGGICGIGYNTKDAWEPIEAVSLDGDATPEHCLDFSDGEVVFGISVNLIPSCVLNEDSFDDPWLAGSYKSITQSNLGTYQLSYHTGFGGTGQNGAVSKSAKIDLPTPKQRTRVRTWVSVVE